MRDLGDLMWAAVDERAGALDDLPAGSAELARMRARVRRGRTVRHTREAAVALPVVAAMVLAGWFGVDRMTRTEPPVTTPEPVVPTPDPTPPPTPDDDGADEAWRNDDRGLPAYQPMPDGLLETTGPGWVVTVHRPTRYLADTDEYEVPVVAMFLVAPDGTHYLAGRFSPDARLAAVGWQAGSPTVDVVVDTVTAGYADGRPGEDYMPATYDLRTGVFAPREGEAIWPGTQDAGSARLVAPGGDRVLAGAERGDVFVLTDLDGSGRATLEYGLAGRDCAPVAWLGADVFLALCVDDAMAAATAGDGPLPWVRDFDPVLVEVVLGGARSVTVTELRHLGAGDPVPQAGAGAWVSDGVVVFPSREDDPLGCWTGVDTWTGDGFVPLHAAQGDETVFTVASAGGLVLVEGIPGCPGGAAGPSTLTLHDPATGTSRLLTGATEDWRPGEPGWVTAGMVAWAAAR